MNFVKKWMKTKNGTTTHRVYHCRNAMLHADTCAGQMLSAPRVLSAVFSKIQSLTETPEFIESLGVQGAALRGKSPGDALTLAQGSLHTIELKHRKLLDRELTAESDEEILALKVIRKETEAAIRAAKQNISALEEMVNNQDIMDRVRHLQKDFSQRSLRFPWYIQRQVIASFLAEVRLDGTGYGKARKLHVVAYRLAGSDELITGGVGEHMSSKLVANQTYIFLRHAVDLLTDPIISQGHPV
jgi:hypothetical protein